MKFLLFILLMGSLSAAAQKHTTMNKETVQQFVAAINAHDVKQVAALMADDHTSTDAMGKETKGKENMTAGWEQCFNWFPDYKIEITETFADGDKVAAFGFVEGSYKANKEHHWRVPASWRAVVSDQKIKSWQVYADTKLPADMMAKGDQHKDANTTPRVTGIGGLFFKCQDPKKVKEWYKEHLHLDAGQYGATLEWRQGDDASKYGCTQWNPFGEKTTYFAPSTKDYMFNYRVAHLEALVEQLKKDGVTIVDTLESYDYGKFIHILDCEGNKVELWEPTDEDYDKVAGKH